MQLVNKLGTSSYQILFDRKEYLYETSTQNKRRFAHLTHSVQTKIAFLPKVREMSVRRHEEIGGDQETNKYVEWQNLEFQNKVKNQKSFFFADLSIRTVWGDISRNEIIVY